MAAITLWTLAMLFQPPVSQPAVPPAIPTPVLVGRTSLPEGSPLILQLRDLESLRGDDPRSLTLICGEAKATVPITGRLSFKTPRYEWRDPSILLGVVPRDGRAAVTVSLSERSGERVLTTEQAIEVAIEPLSRIITPTADPRIDVMVRACRVGLVVNRGVSAEGGPVAMCGFWIRVGEGDVSVPSHVALGLRVEISNGAQHVKTLYLRNIERPPSDLNEGGVRGLPTPLRPVCFSTEERLVEHARDLKIVVTGDAHTALRSVSATSYWEGQLVRRGSEIHVQRRYGP